MTTTFFIPAIDSSLMSPRVLGFRETEEESVRETYTECHWREFVAVANWQWQNTLFFRLGCIQ
jgi:hypothetical protein